MEGELFRRSDSGYCSDVQLWQRFESGEWILPDYDWDSGGERMKTRGGEVIELSPVSRSELPDGVEVKPVEEGVVVIDERGEDAPTVAANPGED